MIGVFPRLLLSLFSISIVSFAIAATPVIDDSENFTMPEEPSIVNDQSASIDRKEDETPLAQDNTDIGSNVKLLDKIQNLQQEVQTLRGQLDTQAHEIKLLQQQQLAFYKRLDKRLPTTSSHSNKLDQAINNVAETSSSYQANPAAEQISYLNAYKLVKNQHFDEALIAMETFVASYPQGTYTANAQYWLGELYIIQKKYSEAVRHFEVVLQQFPDSSKAAASTLKIGYVLAASGHEKEAKKRLKQVLKNYPDTPTAQLAQAKLQSLNLS